MTFGLKMLHFLGAEFLLIITPFTISQAGYLLSAAPQPCSNVMSAYEDILGFLVLATSQYIFYRV